jgi:hypothetical protein
MYHTQQKPDTASAALPTGASIARHAVRSRRTFAVARPWFERTTGVTWPSTGAREVARGQDSPDAPGPSSHR